MGTVDPPSNIDVTAKTALYLDNMASEYDDDIEKKIKQSRSPSQKIESRELSIWTTNTTFNSPSKVIQKASPYEHYFCLEMKINNLRTNISCLKLYREDSPKSSFSSTGFWQ